MSSRQQARRCARPVTRSPPARSPWVGWPAGTPRRVQPAGRRTARYRDRRAISADTSGRMTRQRADADQVGFWLSPGRTPWPRRPRPRNERPPRGQRAEYPAHGLPPSTTPQAHRRGRGELGRRSGLPRARAGCRSTMASRGWAAAGGPSTGLASRCTSSGITVIPPRPARPTPGWRGAGAERPAGDAAEAQLGRGPSSRWARPDDVVP